MNKLVLITFLFIIACHSKKEKDTFETVNQGKLLNKHFFLSISYQKSLRDAAIIPITIEGKQKRFMIDTGSPMVISASLQKELQLPNLMNSTTEDSNGDATGLNIVRIAHLSIGELQFNDIPALVLDFNQMGTCDSIDGFIGSNLLRLLILQFNQPKQQIYIGDCIDSFKLAQGTSISDMSLNFEQSSPVININLNGFIDDSCLYDSGDGVLYTISKIKFDDYNKNGMFTNNIQAIGTGLAAQGIIGKKDNNLPAFVLHFDSISIGQISIKNIYCEPTHAARSRVGRGLWNYGLVTMDYLNRKFYFTPYQKELKAEEPLNFGFKYQEKDGKLKISIVWDESQASVCGLKPGLEIVQFGNFIPKDIPRCDWNIYLKKEEAGGDSIFIKYINEKGETIQCSLPKLGFKN